MTDQTTVLTLADVLAQDNNVEVGNYGYATLDSTMNGLPLPQSTIKVGSATVQGGAFLNLRAGSDSSSLQEILVWSDQGPQAIQFETWDPVGFTFSGCLGGLGNLSTGGEVLSIGPRFAPAGTYTRSGSPPLPTGHTDLALILTGAPSHPGDFIDMPVNASPDPAYVFNLSGYTDDPTHARQVRGIQVSILCGGNFLSSAPNFYVLLRAQDQSFSLGLDQFISQIPTDNAGFINGTIWLTKNISTGSAYLTAADVNNLQVAITSLGPGELRLYQLQVTAFYNDAPDVQVTTPANNSSIYAPHPLFAWTYADAEGDSQQSYRLLIVPTSLATTSGFNPNAYINLGVYLSGMTASQAITTLNAATATLQAQGVSSSDPRFSTAAVIINLLSASTDNTIPPDAYIFDSQNQNSSQTVTTPIGLSLIANETYRGYLLASDLGGRTYNAGLPRYNIIDNTATGGVNQGIDFTLKPEPYLMPAIEFPESPSNWNDALDVITGGINCEVRLRPNILSETEADFMDPTHTTASGTGWGMTTGGFSLSVDTAGLAPGIGRLIWSAAGTAETTQWTVQSGSILTATFKAKGSGTGHAGIGFYSDAAGTVQNGPSVFCPNMPLNGSTWTTLFCSARVPPGTASARLLATLSTAGSITCASLTPNVINLIDDSSFENGGPFWSTTHMTYAKNPDNLSYAYSVFAGLVTGNPIQTSSYYGVQGGTGCQFYIGADIVADSSPTVGLGVAPLNVSSIGGFTNSGASVTLTSTGEYWHAEKVINGADIGSTPCMPSVLPSGGLILVDQMRMEQVWPLPDGTFSSVSAGTDLPLTEALGWPGTGLHWMRGDTGAGSAQVTTGGVSGNCLTVIGPAIAESFFTVSGWTSLEIGYDMKGAFLTGQITLEFFDNAGIGLSVDPITREDTVFILPLPQGNTPTYTAQLVNGIPVPSTAAYARFTTNVTFGTLNLDSVLIVPTGTGQTSVPFIDGGWSGGIGGQGPSYGWVERQDGVSPWMKLRLPFNAAGPIIPNNGAYDMDFVDYEWEGGTYTISQSLYYRAQGSLARADGTFGLTPFSQLAILTQGYGFIISGANAGYWLLIDPLNPNDNIALQVKTSKFETMENQQVLMPVGRGRKVVIGDSPIFGDTITLELQTVLPGDFAAIQRQYSKTHTLGLRSPDGEYWYVRATKRSRERTWTGSLGAALRTYTITFETVDALP